MRIGVLGNSDTTGVRLAPDDARWPDAIAADVARELGQPVEVDNWRFAPYRPRPVEFAMRLVEASEPDLVIVPLASFWCAFATVQTRLYQRYGPRLTGWYLRAERGFRNHAESGSEQPGKPTNGFGRRAVRRVIGTSTLLSERQFIDLYSELIRRLSQRERMQVLVLGDHHFTAYVRAGIPGIEAHIAAIERAIRPLVEERHLLWDDLEPAISEGDRRDDMIGPDGIHMTPEAHQRVAKRLTPVVRQALAAVAR